MTAPMFVNTATMPMSSKIGNQVPMSSQPRGSGRQQRSRIWNSAQILWEQSTHTHTHTHNRVD